MPWLRPMVGVYLCSKARRFSAASSASTSVISMIGGARELHSEARVEHIGRRHALMHEARLGPDDFGEMRQEGDHVVLDLALDLVDARDVEIGVFAFFPDVRARLPWG